MGSDDHHGENDCPLHLDKAFTPPNLFHYILNVRGSRGWPDAPQILRTQNNTSNNWTSISNWLVHSDVAEKNWPADRFHKSSKPFIKRFLHLQTTQISREKNSPVINNLKIENYDACDFLERILCKSGHLQNKSRSDVHTGKKNHPQNCNCLLLSNDWRLSHKTWRKYRNIWSKFQHDCFALFVIRKGNPLQTESPLVRSYKQHGSCPRSLNWWTQCIQ